MTILLECECAKCGAVGEAKLSFAGPHIKMSCNECGFYHKFISPIHIPDIQIIKQRIFAVANEDLGKIQIYKDELGIFYNGISGINAKIAYWELYLKLLKNDL